MEAGEHFVHRVSGDEGIDAHHRRAVNGHPLHVPLLPQSRILLRGGPAKGFRLDLLGRNYPSRQEA
jgi:hypothetical protein